MSIQNLGAPSIGGQSGFLNKYPYTDFHELNLDWLLVNYQHIVDSTNEVITWANNHQIEYEEAIERLTTVENEISTFEADVNSAFDRLTVQLNADFARQKAQLDAALAATQAHVDEQIRLLTQELELTMSDFNVRFNQLENGIKSELASVKIQVNEAIAQLNKRLFDNNEFIFNYVENRLDEFIEEFPDLIDLQVYNPYQGKMTSLQEAVNDLYDMSCIYGLTAIQFDYLDITAQDFDDADLTAREFDQYGYNLLEYPDPRYYMYDPFTGEKALVKTVVQKLAALHTDAESLSAEEFEDLDLTALDFDATDITAFDFDWFSKTLLSA